MGQEEGIPYRTVRIRPEMEYVVNEVWAEKRKLVVVNFYNPNKVKTQQT